MTTLFGKMRIEDYFKQIAGQIRTEIDEYTDQQLVNMDVASVAGKLSDKYQLVAPVIDKTKTKSYVTAEELPSHRFPPQMMVFPGKSYSVEVANYEVPYSGDQELLMCLPKTHGVVGVPVNAEVTNNHIHMKLTEYGKITGNEQMMASLKRTFTDCFERIEQNLANVTRDVEAFHLGLKVDITQYLASKVAQAKGRGDAGDKLNPFK